ncbi:protein TolR [Planctomycetales bacterium]|nr:protein TolR [Planctomycetales bacterium]GHS97272.1 protein TolR [Planctomycetales bacterium]GHT05742.1 protein TolR [Planctomycetales bacterium]GHV21138.1 protein TolR [Planctomycetales bacterium]
MRFTPTAARRGATVNITSLIDVMFLLLIFVLLSAKFETDSGITVALPRGESQETVAPQIQVLSIDRAGDLYFGKQKITLAELPAAIAQMRQKMRDPVLVINADKNVPYGVFAETIDAVKRSEQTKFYFKTAAP